MSNTTHVDAAINKIVDKISRTLESAFTDWSGEETQTKIKMIAELRASMNPSCTCDKHQS